MGKDEGGKGGVLVNISSVAGLFPFSGAPIYDATKHAIIGLTRSFGVSTLYSDVGILYKGRVALCVLCSFFWVKTVSEYYMTEFRNTLSVPFS